MEKELKKLGFKKKWFDDKSAYWFRKKVKYKDFKIIFYVEFDPDVFYMDVETYNVDLRHKSLSKSSIETIALFKCNLKTIKKTLKRYEKT